MKYNRSEIMKNAWKSKKATPWVKFAECLKHAWFIAKRAANDTVIAEGTKFVDGMEITVDGYTCILNRWTKRNSFNGKKMDRVYLNGGSRKGFGYVDLVAKKMVLNTVTTYAEKIANAVLGMAF